MISSLPGLNLYAHCVGVLTLTSLLPSVMAYHSRAKHVFDETQKNTRDWLRVSDEDDDYALSEGKRWSMREARGGQGDHCKHV